MISLYSFMTREGLHIDAAICLFGGFLIVAIALICWRHHHNQSKGDSLHLIGMEKPKDS
jgi:hypothetical protein